jgi:hypothetical protein
MFSNESFQLDFHSELLENLVPKDHLITYEAAQKTA